MMDGVPGTSNSNKEEQNFNNNNFLPDSASNAADLNQKKKPEFQISVATKDRVEACKSYIERKYAKAMQTDREFKENWEQLQLKMACMNMSSVDKKMIEHDVMRQEFEFSRKKRQKISSNDFEPLSIIGRGAFGEVRVCKEKRTGKIVAVKKMKKQEMLSKHQINHIRQERNVLATSGNPWIVDLYCSFQDQKHLYLVMEYLSGGDLMTVLMKKDILSEEESKFYASELVMAIDSVHKMKYIHRDLKPDNILLGRDGHIKLSDFGLCTHAEIKPKMLLGKGEEIVDYSKDLTSLLTKRSQIYKRDRHLVFSTVGTPDYIAPEVFGQQGYTEVIDWWSLGVILFEMLVGYPPFFSEEPATTCQKIINWRKTFGIPKEAGLSPSAEDLIKRLINDQVFRLGVNGVQEIKAHSFFQGIDWERLRQKVPPYVPEVKDELDVSNFDKFEEEEPWNTPNTEGNKKGKNRLQHFQGFTYKKSMETEQLPIKKYLDGFDQVFGQPTQSSNTQTQASNSEQNSKNPMAGILTDSNELSKEEYEKLQGPTGTSKNLASQQSKTISTPPPPSQSVSQVGNSQKIQNSQIIGNNPQQFTMTNSQKNIKQMPDPNSAKTQQQNGVQNQKIGNTQPQQGTYKVPTNVNGVVNGQQSSPRTPNQGINQGNNAQNNQLSKQQQQQQYQQQLNQLQMQQQQQQSQQLQQQYNQQQYISPDVLNQINMNGLRNSLQNPLMQQQQHSQLSSQQQQQYNQQFSYKQGSPQNQGVPISQNNNNNNNNKLAATALLSQLTQQQQLVLQQQQQQQQQFTVQQQQQQLAYSQQQQQQQLAYQQGNRQNPMQNGSRLNQNVSPRFQPDQPTQMQQSQQQQSQQQQSQQSQQQQQQSQIGRNISPKTIPVNLQANFGYNFFNRGGSPNK